MMNLFFWFCVAAAVLFALCHLAGGIEAVAQLFSRRRQK
jgi:hypothetical protein